MSRREQRGLSWELERLETALSNAESGERHQLKRAREQAAKEPSPFRDMLTETSVSLAGRHAREADQLRKQIGHVRRQMK